MFLSPAQSASAYTVKMGSLSTLRVRFKCSVVLRYEMTRFTAVQPFYLFASILRHNMLTTAPEISCHVIVEIYNSVPVA